MAISNIIKYSSVNDLYLDPKNPRLGRENTRKTLTQAQVLDLMSSWTLDELAVSFLESGFWPNEAVIVVHESYRGETRLVVVEGNRRIAALKLLLAAHDKELRNPKWVEIAESAPNNSVFDNLWSIPYILADSRADVQAFLGFRHVTGIKEWKPAEKAEYIATLIDDHNLSYRDVMRQIGSKTPSVRQNYISYRILLQLEDLEDVAVEQVEEKFSVLYLSLRTVGVRQYLQVDINAEPNNAKTPVPSDKLENLAQFALWLFGDRNTSPIVSDSRQVDHFGKVLESKDAVKYLETARRPNLETAYRLAGGDEAEVIEAVTRAVYEIEDALGRAHHHVKSRELHEIVERLAVDVRKLLESFPDVKGLICED